MKILITNDDSISSEVLLPLAKWAKQFGEVTVVVPKYEQSGKSHSITFLDPLYLDKIYLPEADHDVYIVKGTPADCVVMGLDQILDGTPDLLISGHVHGGILRLPFIGAVFAPGNGAPLYKRFGPRYFFPKYSRGLYQKGTKTLAVTQGLGFAILPIRLIPPEIMIIQLKSGKIGNDL